MTLPSPASPALNSTTGNGDSTPYNNRHGKGTSTPDQLYHQLHGTPHVSSETMNIGHIEEGQVKSDVVVRSKVSRLLQGKAAECNVVARKAGPLQLLDLPEDILKYIVKHVSANFHSYLPFKDHQDRISAFAQLTHTNDLTSLAMTNSTLHTLAIPHIYSCFDIVWPEATSTNENRAGVDALSYGLTTLSFASGNFPRQMPRRLGNDYARHTRKFSIGNGPLDWISEYMISKTCGKLLGGLISLAVPNMLSLEQFLWDMPTGVSREVWLALSSLEDPEFPGKCTLEKVLVRWHDNSEHQKGFGFSDGPPIPDNSILTSIGIVDVPEPESESSDDLNPGANARDADRNRVEHPTFSVLPPLRSLSVLDIDELSYLDEMSIAVAKSKDKLRELRVGIARKAQWKDFVLAWDGAHLQQVSNSRFPRAPSETGGDKRLGGVLGILLGRVYDLRTRRGQDPVEIGRQMAWDSEKQMMVPSEKDATAEAVVPEVATSLHSSQLSAATTAQHEGFSGSTAPATVDEELVSMAQTTGLVPPKRFPRMPRESNDSKKATSAYSAGESKRSLEANGRLRLETLELERVPLSIAILQNAFDWTIMTSITLLDCSYHEQFWKMMRKHFRPKTEDSGFGRSTLRNARPHYQLNLKRVHTDHVTQATIAFLKETLAPHSLEVLFLQNRRTISLSGAKVSIDDIKRVLKRHRESLKKVLIDSSDRFSDRAVTHDIRWRHWLVTHEVLDFITNGGMTHLRELSISISYQDWNFFIQRLPQIPTLRSLHFPHIADYIRPEFDSREFARHIVTVIHLCPAIELCYVGLARKCFEILENAPNNGATHGAEATSTADDGTDDDEVETTVEEAIVDSDDEHIDGPDPAFSDAEDEDEEGVPAAHNIEQNISMFGHDDSDVESDSESSASFVPVQEERPKLRLREILYYDDKVAIFKARHMKL